MRIGSYRTSNPVFTSYFWEGDQPSKSKMTVSGIFVKSLFGILVIAAITGWIWNLQDQGVYVRWFTLGGMLAAAIISIVISYKQHLAYVLVPLYIVAKGCFLGGFSAYAHKHFPELPYQAIGVTIITFFVMLVLYQTRIIVVTKKLRSVIITAAVSIFMVYLISFILGLLGIKSYIWGTSWLAITFNVVAAIVASFALLLDFDYIERYKNKATKEKEWLATWGLLATLIWLYIEILRFMQKMAIKY